MADATNFIVLCRDDNTKKYEVSSLFASDIKVHQYKNGNLRFHQLTEGTISAANTGAATDTVIIKDDTSLASFKRSELFNSTIQNENKESQALIGFVFRADHTVTSPDTDKGSLHIELKFRHRTGGAPTYDSKGYDGVSYRLESYVVVEAASIATLPYAGPFAIPFAQPIICKRIESTLEYLGCTTIIHRTTADRPTFTAHTVVTTYTLKVNLHAVLVDMEILQAYNSLSDLWNDIIQDFK